MTQLRTAKAIRRLLPLGDLLRYAVAIFRYLVTVVKDADLGSKPWLALPWLRN